MTVLDRIHEGYLQLARDMGTCTCREDQYSMVLFAKLWPLLGGQLQVSTGLGREYLLPRIKDTSADALRMRRLPKTKDFYADLIVTEAPGPEAPTCFLGLNDFADRLRVTHLFEFKYLSAFTSLSRGVARKDGYKLKVLGEYVRCMCGTAPHMEQVIFNFHRPGKKMRTNEQLASWFRGDDFLKEAEGVSVLIVDSSGAMTAVR